MLLLVLIYDDALIDNRFGGCTYKVISKAKHWNKEDYRINYKIDKTNSRTTIHYNIIKND